MREQEADEKEGWRGKAAGARKGLQTERKREVACCTLLLSGIALIGQIVACEASCCGDYCLTQSESLCRGQVPYAVCVEDDRSGTCVCEWGKEGVNGTVECGLSDKGVEQRTKISMVTWIIIGVVIVIVAAMASFCVWLHFKHLSFKTTKNHDLGKKHSQSFKRAPSAAAKGAQVLGQSVRNLQALPSVKDIHRLPSAYKPPF